MDLGSKILELRKKNGLSQEKLAEKIGVTRQTISKWELGETTPDINQVKELSKIFQISLDELTDNDIKDVIVEKVNNTEKNTNFLSKIIKYIAIGFVILLVIDIITFVYFFVNKIGPFESDKNDKINVSVIDDYLYNIEGGMV